MAIRFGESARRAAVTAAAGAAALLVAATSGGAQTIYSIGPDGRAVVTIQEKSSGAGREAPAVQPRRPGRAPARTVQPRRPSRSPVVVVQPVSRRPMPRISTDERRDVRIRLTRPARTPAGPDSLNDRAYGLQRQGRHREAEALLRRALQKAPEHAYAQYNLGWSLLEQGRAREAVQHLKRTAQKQRGRWEPHLRLGQAYERLGDEARARIHYARARALGYASGGRSRSATR